jgi:hypothetical protein
MLGFKAGVQVDTVAYPVFWWELQTINPDFAERLNMDVRNTLLDWVNMDVRNTLLDRVTI